MSQQKISGKRCQKHQFLLNYLSDSFLLAPILYDDYHNITHTHITLDISTGILLFTLIWFKPTGCEVCVFYK